MRFLADKKYRAIIVVILLVALLSGCRNFTNEANPEKLSDVIVGQWYGQVDIAKMVYKELDDELGIELSPDPAYCDIYFEFEDDGTSIFKIDSESFAKAVGECAEPYTSALFGFDTGSLVDIIMQYVAKEMPADTGEDQGTYDVNDDEMAVSITTESGEVITLIMDNEGHLQYEDEEINQTVLLEKQ